MSISSFNDGSSETEPYEGLPADKPIESAQIASEYFRAHPTAQLFFFRWNKYVVRADWQGNVWLYETDNQILDTFLNTYSNLYQRNFEITPRKRF